MRTNDTEKEKPTYIEQVAEIEGIKTSSSAMRACGMQPELAAHLALQNKSMGISIILRAGSPPVYNQKRGPKTGFNLSKTSTQGLFRGSLAADTIFTRIDPETGHGKGHDKKDAHHLHLPITHPDYQHTVPLPVTMQDILREIGPDGDLVVLGYNEDNGQLRLAYKEGKGDIAFKGQFVLNLNQGDAAPMFYSRPWDRPDHHPQWDATNQVIRKPDSLAAVPDDVYKAVFNQSFTVNYSSTQDLEPNDVIPAKVFANTPRTSADLYQAVLASGVLDVSNESHREILEIDEHNLPPREVILALLTTAEIEQVYNACALVTTGDWDGLALGQPPLLMADFPTPEEIRVYNTFSVEHGRAEQYGLVEASCAYFNYLKAKPETQGTPLGELLATIEDPHTLFSEFAVARAGCITPHEFLYEQLINYSYRDQLNSAYGNNRSRDAIQSGMNAALAWAQKNPDSDFEDCLVAAEAAYDKALVVRRASMATGQANQLPTESTVHQWRSIDLEHLENHLKIALETEAKEYTVPNVSHDHNVHDLFQHGFDMRNPYGSNLEGAWLMITNEGATIYGDTQEQLTEALLIEGFLENNVITVSHGADMQAGWGAVVERQIDLKQPVSDQTMTKYSDWRANENKIAQASFKEQMAAMKAEPTEDHTLAPHLPGPGGS